MAILTSLVHYKYVGSTGGGLPHVNTFDEGQPRAARWEREREQESRGSLFTWPISPSKHKPAC